MSHCPHCGQLCPAAFTHSPAPQPPGSDQEILAARRVVEERAAP